MKQDIEKVLRVLEFTAVRESIKRLCASPLGRDLAVRTTPFDSIEKAERALQQVMEMRDFLSEGGKCTFRGSNDAVGIIERALKNNKSIDPSDLYSVGALLTCATRLRFSFEENLSGKPELETLISKMPDLEDLETELKNTVDADGCLLSTASPRLAETRRGMERLQREIRSKAESMLSRREVTRHLQEQTFSFREGRLVFPVRYECRKKLNGILHDFSASGNTAFMEPEELVEVHNSLEKKRLLEKREITKILWERTRRLIDSMDEIRAGQRVVAWLDFTIARTRYSERYGMQAPKISRDGVMVLRRARHPILLEMAYERCEGDDDEKRMFALDNVVPLDIHLGDRFDILVVTGPNTGGKTVALKTAGLLSLMAASGLPLPAAEGTVVPFFNDVLVDIGDEQDLTRSLSTFSSHMQRVSIVLERADFMTLVLLDELGTGTDPLEGEALGRAILKFLSAKKAKVMVTTHLSKLKEYAFSSPRVENACMEFDPDTLSPTFRLRIGIPGESNAIRIARRLGIPQPILDEAEDALEADNREFKELMDTVQRIRVQDEKSLEQSQKDAQAVRKLKEEVEIKKRELDFKRTVLEQEAEREIDEYLRRARESALPILSKLENVPAAHKDDLLELRRFLDRMIERSPLGKKRLRFIKTLKKGDQVYIPRYREKCLVISINKKDELVEVAYRSLSVKVSFQEIIWPHWF